MWAHCSVKGMVIKELERELDKEDKALAETASLLVLKKTKDIWGDSEEGK